MVEYSATKEAATHRYPTSIKWGRGYFGDGFKYVVASNTFQLYQIIGSFCPRACIQEKVNGEWCFAEKARP